MPKMEPGSPARRSKPTIVDDYRSLHGTAAHDVKRTFAKIPTVDVEFLVSVNPPRAPRRKSKSGPQPIRVLSRNRPFP